MVNISIRHLDDQLKVIHWDVVLAVRWYDVPVLKSLECYRTLQRAHIDQLAGTPALIISYSDASGDKLDFEPGLRRAVEEAFQDAHSNVLGMAQIIAGEGFGAASVRSVLSGLQLSLRPPYPIKLFGDFASALPWIVQLLHDSERPQIADEIAATLVPELEPGLD